MEGSLEQEFLEDFFFIKKRGGGEGRGGEGRGREGR